MKVRQVVRISIWTLLYPEDTEPWWCAFLISLTFMGGWLRALQGIEILFSNNDLLSIAMAYGCFIGAIWYGNAAWHAWRKW
jgi:hypothetical protein